MVQAQHNALIAFSADESIGTILVEGTSRAFCAGMAPVSLSPCPLLPLLVQALDLDKADSAASCRR